MGTSKSVSRFVFILISGIGLLIEYSLFRENLLLGEALIVGVVFLFLAFLISSSLKIADFWERAIVLRLGKFYSLEGPGFFFIIPIIDTVPFWIDTRVIHSSIVGEKAMTKDAVPVIVDAALFWKVADPISASLKIVDYKGAIFVAIKMSLREVIGKTMLSELLAGRERMGKELKRILNERTETWGVSIMSIEILDLMMPYSLENGVTMQSPLSEHHEKSLEEPESLQMESDSEGFQKKIILNEPELNYADQWQQRY
jgi:regulator of protease activity HflC (stomatin/prohibitin superfamily)